jgi:hypothetical protein
MVNNDIFPGGMMTMLVVVPPGVPMPMMDMPMPTPMPMPMPMDAPVHKGNESVPMAQR